MRTWFYQTLLASDFMDTLPGGLLESSRTTKVPSKKPYSYYRLGPSIGQVHSSAPARSTPVQLFVYDEPGDFELIETQLELARLALVAQPPLVYDARLISCVWRGLSGDVSEDPLTGTIAKFANFTIIHT